MTDIFYLIFGVFFVAVIVIGCRHKPSEAEYHHEHLKRQRAARLNIPASQITREGVEAEAERVVENK